MSIFLSVMRNENLFIIFFLIRDKHLTNGENLSPTLNAVGLFKLLSEVKKLPITESFNLMGGD